MSGLDERTASYIAETAQAMSERLEARKLWEVDTPLALCDLTHDVAWLARQVARLTGVNLGEKPTP